MAARKHTAVFVIGLAQFVVRPPSDPPETSVSSTWKEPRPKLSSIAGPIRGGYVRSDRRSANCLNPQLRASADATAHVGV